MATHYGDGSRTYFEIIDWKRGVIPASVTKQASFMHYLLESEEDAKIWLDTLTPSRREELQTIGYRKWHPDFIAACHVELLHPRLAR